MQKHSSTSLTASQITTLPDKEKGKVIPDKKSNTVFLPDGRIARLPEEDLEKQPQAKQANLPVSRNSLRVIPLGGQDGGGNKNMIVVEYGDEAIVIDTGHNLGIELPGVNFSIPNIQYLESIKNKVKGYVFTHGHLDHIGGLPFVLPKVPAPLYGSRFTVGMLEKELKEMPGLKFKPKTVILNEDNHDRVKLGANFTLELVRVTHSIPGSTAVVIDTPAGRLINTGDFRLDPEPLDHMPTDLERLKQLGNEGVLLLMSESTTTQRLGRTPTESTLEPTFHDIFKRTDGRIIVASFSSNVNRVQMIVNAAVGTGRKVSIMGRSMLAHVELAVRLGILKVPAGTVVRSSDIPKLADGKVVIICTGGQGEEFAALSRMSTGDHPHVKIKKGDTIVFSSTPIPYTGNDESVRQIVDGLMRQGANVFRADHHEVDGCGPLHVSGHASTEEFKEMIQMTKPKYFVPIYGDYQSRRRHLAISEQAGIPPKNSLLIDNGEVLEVSRELMKVSGTVPAGNVMVDNTGKVVPGIVIKDRLALMEGGILIVILTMKAENGELLTSPDIITRGFIQVDESQQLMRDTRELVKAFAIKNRKKYRDEGFKLDLRDYLANQLYKKTKLNPMVISVINLIGKNGQTNIKPKPNPDCL